MLTTNSQTNANDTRGVCLELELFVQGDITRFTPYFTIKGCTLYYSMLHVIWMLVDVKAAFKWWENSKHGTRQVKHESSQSLRVKICVKFHLNRHINVRIWMKWWQSPIFKKSHIEGRNFPTSWNKEYVKRKMTSSSTDAFAFERDVNVDDTFTYWANVRVKSKRGRFLHRLCTYYRYSTRHAVYSRHRRKQIVMIS